VRFRAAVRLAAPEVELLPSHLARVGAQVLGVAGLGLSLVGPNFRVPIGASDDPSGAAERLQFTVGEGPCLQAMHNGTELRASEADIARRWPAFHDELIRKSPFRSIVSVPLRLNGALKGAADIYFIGGGGALYADLDAAVAVVTDITHELLRASTPGIASLTRPNRTVPAWAYSPDSVSRIRVWIAAGVLIAKLDLTPADAVARLRGFAYSRECDINDVADAVIDGSVAPDLLAT
jgi:hypothetical protein